MSKLGPSLEDLLPQSAAPIASDDETQGEKLQQKIKNINLKEKEDEVNQTAQVLGLPYINLEGFPIGPEILTTLPKAQAKELKTICFFNNGQEIRLGTVDYNDAIKKLEAELKENLFAHVSTYLISEHSFEHAAKLYDTLPEVKKFATGVVITEADLQKFETEVKSFRDLNEKIQHTSVTEVVTFMVASAIGARASDIHIEAEENEIKIRFRIDGVLNDVASLKKDQWSKVASRIKNLAGLKINITDKPQDGRFSIYKKDERVDVRVSTLPTAFGESIVMRLLLSSQAATLSFEDLGLKGESFKILEREIHRPNGMIITTGPTGSGKTTTLYAILRQLNNPDTKIITIEDPIEYELKGINQSQVNEDYTFAKGLRSIVRQDPDIIMVGEIRDLETTEIAIQAALTGHLVLSTIHTNDAFGTIPRFLALGAKPFLLAPSLNVAIGQRLVRRLCDCKKEAVLTPDEFAHVKKLIETLPEKYKINQDASALKFYTAGGCEKCQGIGYFGRVGIYEIMPIEGEIKEAVTQGNISEDQIKAMANRMGVMTMAQDGILKAIEGTTSVDEVFRVAE